MSRHSIFIVYETYLLLLNHPFATKVDKRVSPCALVSLGPVSLKAAMEEIE